jgi:hypothetical protein
MAQDPAETASNSEHEASASAASGGDPPGACASASDTDFASPEPLKPSETPPSSETPAPPFPPETGAAPEPLGANLEPVLRQACGDRLSSIRWFRADWQRGGALTGYSEYQTDEEGPTRLL